MAHETRRDFLKVTAGTAGLTALGVRSQAAKGAATKPNLLFMHTDQLSSWALSVYAPHFAKTPNYGKTLVETPHLDRIGREGAVLTNFMVNSAVCTPSRGCMVTGRYPHCHGAYRNNIELNRDEVTIAHVLKRNGYDTGYSGKWHLDGPPKPGFMKPERSMGFDDCRYMFNRGHWKQVLEDEHGNPSITKYGDIGDEKTYTTDYLATKTIEFINRPRTGPFFYLVSFPDPHTPFTVREPHMSMYKAGDMPVPKTFKEGAGKKRRGRKRNVEWLRKAKAHYCGLVKCIDDNVGRILQALEEKNVLDDTIVVFTTDHGEYMGEHGLWGKNQWYRTAYQVPFLIRWPAKITRSTVIDRFVTMVDAMPTLLGLMGIPGSDREQGLDASPLLRGENVAWVDEAQIHHSSLQGAGIFTPRYELVLKSSGEHMLFDRRSDPEQVKNLTEDPTHKKVFMDLARKVLEHHRELKSPVMDWLNLDGLEGGATGEPDEEGVVYRKPKLEKDTRGTKGRFTRIVTTPNGLLKANSEYVISFDYTSAGLDGEDSAFYYTLRPGNDRSKQTGPIKWRAQSGESGRKEHRLATGKHGNFALILGIYKQGAIEIRDLTITKPN